MVSLGALGFAAPWALVGFVLLPALWWLLRATPPSPRRVVFPPLRLLETLSSREQAAVRTPWWLLILRLALAASLVLGVAHPLLDADQMPAGSGPVYILFDDGWSAAASWTARQAALMQTVDHAERDGRPIVLVPTAATDDAPASRPPPVLLTASAARERAGLMRPQPWATDRDDAVEALLRAANAGGWSPGTVVWISDGLTEPAPAQPGSPRRSAAWAPGAGPALLERLRALGRPLVLLPEAARLPLLSRPADGGTSGPAVTLVRAGGVGERTAELRLSADDGTVLSRQPTTFAAGERQATVAVDLPTELAARLARIDIEGEATAGAVVLVDERSQRRAVGLLAAGDSGEQPLLGGRYYLRRALEPFAEVREGDLAQLLARPLAALILADVGSLDAASAETVGRWVEQGGVLLRFAGPRLAHEATADDPLLPVPLRAGDRALGGTLSWSGTARLAPFDRGSPFSGIDIPPDIEISRQVVAEPTLDAAEHTWARLDDGTPLISGLHRGKGWVVLVHTTADPGWSNLPLSGLFVELLHRIVDMGAGGRGGAEAAMLPPLELLDGFGRLGTPPADARAIAGPALASTVVGPGHPPGFYGTPEARRALVLGASVPDPMPLAPVVEGAAAGDVATATLGASAERDLRPWLLGAALLLAILDLAVSLWMRGLLRIRGAPAGRIFSLLLLAPSMALAAVPGPAAAQTVVGDGTAAPASLTMRLAFVRTGDAADDQVSEAGLAGLGLVVVRRTAAELGPPVGVDPETDELAFYPLLYWPISPSTQPLSAGAAAKLRDYMRAGGTIVFDTRGRGVPSDSGALRDLARQLDLPPLVPVADDHVLRRSYYLLGDMPGRWAAGPVWVESPDEHVNDGVSAVVAGSADWAGAWAVDRTQRPLFAASPGGERQREQAYRFGINLVMYVLTGNYKADQVHLPAILERLGQ